MTKPAYVDVSALSDGFTPSLVEELRASIDSSGDCAVCRRDLGTGDIVIDVCPIPGASSVDVAATCARHASCGPVTQQVGIDFSPDPTWRGLERVMDNGHGEPFIVVTINPSVDHYIVRRHSGEAHLTDLWSEFGFQSPKQSDVMGAMVGTVRWYAHEGTIQITTALGQWGLEVHPLVGHAIRDCGGLMISLLFDRDATSTDKETLMDFLTCPYAAQGAVQYVE